LFCAVCIEPLLCGRWKSEVSDLRQSSKRDQDKQSRLVDQMQKLVTYQKSEMSKLQANKDANHNLVQKIELLESQLKVRMVDGWQSFAIVTSAET